MQGADGIRLAASSSQSHNKYQQEAKPAPAAPCRRAGTVRGGPSRVPGMVRDTWAERGSSVWPGVTPMGLVPREQSAGSPLQRSCSHWHRQDSVRTSASRGVWGHASGEGSPTASASCSRGAQLCSREALQPRKNICSFSRASSSAGIPWRLGWGPSFPGTYRAGGLLFPAALGRRWRRRGRDAALTRPAQDPRAAPVPGRPPEAVPGGTQTRCPAAPCRRPAPQGSNLL